MRIAFLGVRVPGHLNPMTTLARKLKARGHDVVFISVLDSEPHVRAAQLPFIPYCEKEMPLGLVRQEAEQLSKLQGQAALEFTIRVVASGLETFFKNLPQTLLEARVDALVLDQVDTGLGLVPMHLGIPYVHVSNALHLDYSGNTPLCTFDWPHETTPEALARNQAGVRGLMQVIEPVTSVADAYAAQVSDATREVLGKLAIGRICYLLFGVRTRNRNLSTWKELCLLVDRSANARHEKR
jgi:zeaxanthin glucosyltransferase